MSDGELVQVYPGVTAIKQHWGYQFYLYGRACNLNRITLNPRVWSHYKSHNSDQYMLLLPNTAFKAMLEYRCSPSPQRVVYRLLPGGKQQLIVAWKTRWPDNWQRKAWYAAGLDDEAWAAQRVMAKMLMSGVSGHGAYGLLHKLAREDYGNT